MTLSRGLLILCLVSAIGYAENNNANVEAVIGHSVKVPCNIPTPLSAGEASLILWYRQGEPNPIYTLDVRNKPAVHFPASNRTSFNIDTHPPVLVIQSVNPEDEGYYKCRVDLKKSRTLILHSRLKIIVPPGEPMLMDEYGQRLYGIVGPYDEGARVTLVCEVDGGNPLPSVTWWKGDVLLDDSYEDTDQGFVRNEMVVDRIERKDWMTNYTCKASNTIATTPKSASIKLDMNLAPQEVKIILPEKLIRAGEEQGVVCQTRGSRPRALTSWWIDGKKLEGSSELLADDGNVTLSALHFTPTWADNGRLLVCRATNPALPKKLMETETTLDVQFLPRLNLTLGHVLSIKEGSNVYLECGVESNPPIFNMTWRFENRSLTFYRSIGFVILNRTLLLQKVRRAHSGNYTCHAHNDVGDGSSNPLHIRVQYAPICKHSEMKMYGVSPSETVHLSCDLLSDPATTEYRWSLNNTSDVPIDWMNGSTLLYSAENGFGMVKCWGANRIGTQKSPCLFMIVPAANPEVPQDCDIKNQTSFFMTIECKSGYDGGLPQLFHLEIYDSNSERLIRNQTVAGSPAFQVRGLLESTSYVLLIYATNEKGRSKSVTLLTSTPSATPATEIKLSLSPVLVGLVTLSIVASILVIGVLKSRRKPKKSSKEDTIKCEKKDLDQQTELKGPDIIPLSLDSDVFYMGKVQKKELRISPDSPPTEFIRKKYMHTAL